MRPGRAGRPDAEPLPKVRSTRVAGRSRSSVRTSPVGTDDLDDPRDRDPRVAVRDLVDPPRPTVHAFGHTEWADRTHFARFPRLAARPVAARGEVCRAGRAVGKVPATLGR